MILVTLDNILQASHRRYDGSTDYPASTEDDYVVRMGVLNDLIGVWEKEPVDWNELIELDHTIVSGGTKIENLPANFEKMNGKVYVDGNELNYIKPTERAAVLELNPSAKFYTIYGKPGAKKLYCNPAPVNGVNIIFDYYRIVVKMATGTDQPDMSDTMFLYNGLVAFLYEQDARTDKSTEYENKASDSLSNMIILNEVNPNDETEVLETRDNNITRKRQL